MNNRKLPLAIVLDISETGYGVIQSLSSKGVPVMGFHTSKYFPVGKDSNLVVNNLVDNTLTEDEKVEVLLKIAEGEKQKPVLIPSSDLDVNFLARNRKSLEGKMVIPYSNRYNLESALNKDKMRDIAIATGLNVPETIFFDTHSDYTLLENFVTPAIIKPSTSLLGYKEHMKIVQSPKELIEAVEKVLPNCESLTISKYIGGDSKVWECAGFIDNKSGEPVITAMIQKMRQHPSMDCGSGTFVTSDWNEELAKQTISFLKELDFREGSLHIEYKFDSGNGRAYFIETNYRPSSSQKISGDSGVNTVFLAYLNSIGQPITFDGRLFHQSNWVEEMRDWKVAHSNQIELDELLDSYLRVNSFALFNARDRHVYEMIKSKTITTLTKSEYNIFKKAIDLLESKMN